MKQQIILWAGAFIITFLFGYLESVTGKDYPISGTFGIEGKKVSYFLQKTWKSNSDFQTIIRTDVDGVSGKIFWKKTDDAEWNISALKEEENVLIGEIPLQPPLTEVLYKIELNYEDEKLVKETAPVKLKFLGEVNKTIYYLFYFTLFAGLFLSTRTGLEFFNEKERIQKLTIFTVIFFFLYFIITPLKNTYEVGGFDRVPGLIELYNLNAPVLFGIWIIGMILIFKIKKRKEAALITAVVTLLLFLFI